jgi:hypothetical protein
MEGTESMTNLKKQIAELRRLQKKAEATKQWGAFRLFGQRADALEKEASRGN